jgi:hypothetical protein
MANYNTFLVVDCKTRRTVLNTSSARKASRLLKTGIRIEVWNNNAIVETIYERDRRAEGNPLRPYIEKEREYIRDKQARAEKRNAARRARTQARLGM